MSAEAGNTYIGYEYKEVSAAGEDASLLLDCYENFGWVPDDNRPMDTGGRKVALHLKRNRKIINRMELTRLQRNFESCIQEIRQMEQAKKQAAAALALLAGLAGTALMAGAVFAVTSDPPRYLLTVVLAVPAFAGWIFPPFLYRSEFRRQTRKKKPLIEAKYEEIYRLCEKGHDLL